MESTVLTVPTVKMISSFARTCRTEIEWALQIKLWFCEWINKTSDTQCQLNQGDNDNQSLLVVILAKEQKDHNLNENIKSNNLSSSCQE